MVAITTMIACSTLVFWLSVSAVDSLAPPFVASTRKGWMLRSGVVAERQTRSSVPRSSSSHNSALSMKYTLVLVRHGESTWNNENKVGLTLLLLLSVGLLASLLVGETRNRAVGLLVGGYG